MECYLLTYVYLRILFFFLFLVCWVIEYFNPFLIRYSSSSILHKLQYKYKDYLYQVLIYIFFHRHPTFNAEVIGESNLCNDMSWSLYGTDDCFRIHCFSAKIFGNSVSTFKCTSINIYRYLLIIYKDLSIFVIFDFFLFLN